MSIVNENRFRVAAAHLSLSVTRVAERTFEHAYESRQDFCGLKRQSDVAPISNRASTHTNHEGTFFNPLWCAAVQTLTDKQLWLPHDGHVRSAQRSLEYPSKRAHFLHQL